jgi:enoyl-CoA hydratase/carnithine racemase
MLEITDHGPIREIQLNRPPVNALSPEFVAQLDHALKAAGSEARAVVLSGREGMFSAGLDVPALLQLGTDDMGRFWRSFCALLETIGCMPVPLAVAITGHSPAGGAVMALFGDYRVMSVGRYKIGLNETQVGLMLPAFIHQTLVRLVGAHRAERLIVSGALISPEQALQAGLVDELASDPEAAVQAAMAWCEEHLKLPRQAMLGNRKTMRADLTALFAGAAEAEHEAFLRVWFSEETQSTLQALVASLKKK